MHLVATLDRVVPDIQHSAARRRGSVAEPILPNRESSDLVTDVTGRKHGRPKYRKAEAKTTRRPLWVKVGKVGETEGAGQAAANEGAGRALDNHAQFQSQKYRAAQCVCGSAE